MANKWLNGWAIVARVPVTCPHTHEPDYTLEYYQDCIHNEAEAKEQLAELEKLHPDADLLIIESGWLDP